MKKKIILLVLMTFINGYATTASFADKSRMSFNPTGKTYYTRANIWYTKQNEISSVNWHVGGILWAGTQVKIIGYGRNKIVFEANNISEPFVLINARRFSVIKTEDLFGEFFSKEDIFAQDGLVSKFTQEEKENIKNGVISEGMSKEAVLVAYGYPPSHRTPDVASDYWQYWINKFKRELVYFRDNKIVKIEHTMRPGR